MKWVPVIAGIVFSCAAFAADDASQATLKPTPKPGVVIIDGKKFFPLANARRFTSAGPSAMRVAHHPRPAGTIVTRGTQSSPAGDDYAVKPTPATTTSPNDVLSVFAPEDKTPPAAVATKISPATPLNAPTKQ